MKKGLKIIIVIILIVFMFFLLLGNFNTDNEVLGIKLTNNVSNNSQYVLEVSFKNKDDKKTHCLLSKDDNATGDWVKIKNGTCTLNVAYGEYNLFIRDSLGNVYKYDKDYVIEAVADKDKYVMYKGMEQVIPYNILRIGGNRNNLIFKSEDENIITVNDNHINAINYGNSKVDIMYDNKIIESVDVTVSSLIRDVHSYVEKQYVTCGQFTEEEANLADELLMQRVMDAGEGTRAGVLAAARFITLEFNYRIPYFYENGRLDNYDPYIYVDGEGRYYHKGLYLHANKYKDLKATFVGPATWGCNLKNFTNAAPFKSGEYYPNGLDCSGFISWVLYNGGMNIGDIGAGTDYNHFDYTDVGTKKYITNDLINSGEIKAGDLIGLDGHIAIIIGIDDTNYYIGEALPNTGGVAITTVRKDKLTSSIYKYVMLMDNVYNGNGNYTVMW